MRNLSDVIDLASDSSSCVESALLKAKALAAQIGDDEASAWIRSELVGYEPGVALPDYRVIPVRPRFHFVNVNVQGNKDIPESALPEEISTWEVRQGIGSLETLIAADNPSPRIPLPDLVLKLLQSKVADAAVTSAWLEVAPGSVQSIISAIRSRLLDLALSVREPATDKADTLPAVPPSGTVIVNHNVANIHGTAANVAVGGSNMSQTASVHVGDLDALVRVLDALGLDVADKEALVDAVKSEPPKPEQKTLGSRVTGALGMIAGKASETAIGVLTKAVLGHYGIG